MKGIILTIFLTTIVSCSSNQKTSNADRSLIYYAHGTEKLLAQDYTEALKHLLKADEIQPNNSKTLNNLAMAYYFKNRPLKAIELLKRSIEINSKNSDARNNLASIYFNQGKLEDARAQYLIVLDDLLYQHSYRVYYNLGLIDLKRNNIQSAVANLVQAEGLKVDYCAANYQLARIYKQIKKTNKAAVHFEKSVRGDCKNSIAPYYHWGVLLNELGKDKEAITKFDKIIKDHPTNSYSAMAQKRKDLITREGAALANKYEKVETFNSGDF